MQGLNFSVLVEEQWGRNLVSDRVGALLVCMSRYAGWEQNNHKAGPSVLELVSKVYVSQGKIWIYILIQSQPGDNF